MADLTLSIDDELLQRAREAALRDALVREYLTRHVDARRRRSEALDVLDALAASTSSRSTGRWTRGEWRQRPGTSG